MEDQKINFLIKILIQKRYYYTEIFVDIENTDNRLRSKGTVQYRMDADHSLLR